MVMAMEYGSLSPVEQPARQCAGFSRIFFPKISYFLSSH